MNDTEDLLEYNIFIADLVRTRWGTELERSNCRVMVKFPYHTKTGIYVDYEEWCEANCNEEYYVYNENYVFFETKEDAIAFKLRWI